MARWLSIDRSLDLSIARSWIALSRSLAARSLAALSLAAGSLARWLAGSLLSLARFSLALAGSLASSLLALSLARSLAGSRSLARRPAPVFVLFIPSFSFY